MRPAASRSGLPKWHNDPDCARPAREEMTSPVMEHQKTDQATDQTKTPLLEEQVRQLTLRIADLERRLFEVENQPPLQVE
jgi:hypothetical protein